MKHLFIPCVLAIMAKEKGFNEPCIGLYLENNQLYSLTNSTSDFTSVTNENKKHESAAPTYQQIVDWFREKHGIVITPALYSRRHFNEDNNFIFRGELSHPKLGSSHTEKTSEYYEAFNKAIEEAFKLI